jgi:hypothetical protein
VREPGPAVARRTDVQRRISAAAAGLAVVWLLAACGDDPTSGTGDDGRMSDASSGSEPASTSPSAPLEDLSRTPNPESPQVRVEGTVVEGVEHGCLLLVSSGEEYLLLGARPDVGARVEVVGTIDRGAMSTCQQGVPLRVEEITER